MGGSVYCKDTKGYTALHFAVVRGHLDIVKLIVAHSAAIVHMKEYIHGWDALTMAAKEKKEEIVLTMLCSPDISVDAVDNSGYTPLARILKDFDMNSEICIALIVHGASLTNLHVSYNSHKRILQEALFRRDIVPVRHMLLASTNMPVVLVDIIAAYSCVCPEEECKPCKRRTGWRQWLRSIRKRVLYFNCFPILK
jgi:ankyrin repeat protein